MAAGTHEGARRGGPLQRRAPDVYRSFGFPGADDLGNMFQFKRDFNDVYCGHRNLAKARELFPALQSYQAWLAENASKIPISKK